MVGGKKLACGGPMMGGGRRLIFDGIAVRRIKVVSADWQAVSQ